MTKIPHNMRDLAGQRSGRLLVVRALDTRSPDGHILWECRCDCGAVVNVSSNSLVRSHGGTQSCGCLRREVSSRPKQAWNAGRTYCIPSPDGSERVYSQKHSWAKAARRTYGDVCQECGWNAAMCDVHHLVPRSAGGQHVLSNARVLCPNCHRVAHQ